MDIDGEKLEEIEKLLMNQMSLLCDDELLSDSEKLNNLALRNSELTKLVQTYLEIQKTKVEERKSRPY